MPPCTNCCFLSQSSSSLSVELPAGLGQGTSPLSHLSGMVDSKAAVEQDSHPQVQPVSAAMMKWYSSKHSQEALGVAALPSLCCRKRGIFPRLEHLCFHLPRKVFPWNQKVRSGDPAPNRVWRRHREQILRSSGGPGRLTGYSESCLPYSSALILIFCSSVAPASCTTLWYKSGAADDSHQGSWRAVRLSEREHVLSQRELLSNLPFGTGTFI
ncbi:uncharacterized protein LOC110364635 isoform X8 [Columba livia]|uniref:uncharacterized protein LOC110364635 isoform X8 n=1 Tax=Columba livia TaxID=8932 RepID=UPI0031B9DA85